MLDLFFTVLNMSITAGAACIIIMLVRGSIGRILPQTFSYALWGIVLYRMIVPFSFPSIFSALGNMKRSMDSYTSAIKAVSMKETIGFEALSAHRVQELSILSPAGTGLPEGSSQLTESSSAVLGQADYLLITAVVIWLLGFFALLIYHVIFYAKLRKSLSTATLADYKMLSEECKEEIGLKRSIGVYESDKVQSPFVYGFLSPKVVLPLYAGSVLDEENREQIKHVLLHEFCHIKRWDHLIKPLLFLALCIHWFNPVLWIAFKLFNQDMEMSCDEGVVKVLKSGQKEDYAASLLNMASAIRIRPKSALAFQATNVGERVKHIVKYKKPKLAVAALALALLLICAVCLLSNPINLGSGMVDGQENVIVLCSTDGTDIADTILLLGFNSDREGVNVAFIPRDITVDPESEAKGKLSLYAGENSPDEVMAKLGDLLGVKVDHYVKLNTGIFRDLVDAAGGIEFDVPVRMLYNDPYQNLSIDLQPGRQVLNGENAEMLMRYRKGYEEGDLKRIGVQQAFLEAALEQKSDMKISAAEVYRLLSKEMETDLDMKTARTLISLLQKNGEKGEGINFIELPVVLNSDNFWTLAFAPETAEIINNYF